MRKVVIVSSGELSPQLERSILSRANIERVIALDHRRAFEVACAEKPQLLIVDSAEPEVAAALLRRIRQAEETRATSLAVVVKAPEPEVDAELRRAGANLVLSSLMVPFMWDRWLEELLNVPRRRAIRLPVAFQVWCHTDHHERPPIVGTTVNLSTAGLLIDTDIPLEVGETLDLAFRLPGDETELRVVGDVTRKAEPFAGRHRAGVKLRLDEPQRDRISAFVDANTRP